MFKPIFASMNEVLDEIIRDFPNATGTRKEELNEKIQVLKAMSDSMIEEWLLFEEKIRTLPSEQNSSDNVSSHHPFSLSQLLEQQGGQLSPELKSSEFIKGQGYFKLYMFKEAIGYFKAIVAAQPDYLLARLYLALAYLKTGDMNEAYPHFQMIIPMTDNKMMKAISYNALGCIQARNQNTEKACEYFKMAYQLDPSIVEPLSNLEMVQHKSDTMNLSAGLNH
ncbi:hypothetical protein SY83_18395 [Paenibacillus swuensis]|uniref:Uncharacterized protein n=2 Tax=Paenibacillus swuensis TaxID=1178515 RepID=A0A172TQH4_9BACL|nr:hypothetical protein SY83_18395 [Paenibacillus swuensis]